MGLMTDSPGSEDESSFVRLSRNERDDGTPIVSVAAFQLHGFAVVHSVKDGTPGFVSDDYLDAVALGAAVTVAELRVIGLWERDARRGGYVMHDPLMVSQAVAVEERLSRGRAFCAGRGGHEPDVASGGTTCRRCHVVI